MKTVYLAGPDVFLKQADAHFVALEAECAALGLRGLRPSDGGLGLPTESAQATTPSQAAERIYLANVALIRRADFVLANLVPFRGLVEPDSGTVFEIGMAIALGKPVAGIVPNAHIAAEVKVRESFGVEPRAMSGSLFDKTHGMMVEEFDQPTNLMISRSCAIFPTAQAALGYLARL